VNETRRSSVEILTRTGGVFWGIVLMVVGLVSLLAALGYIVVDFPVVVSLLVILAGVWLIIYKLMPEKFP
jgi:hypothetical protein